MNTTPPVAAPPLLAARLPQVLFALGLSFFAAGQLSAQPASWVSSVSPAQNALNVNRVSTITITFTQDVDPATLTNSTIRVNGSQIGLHAGTVSYNSSQKTATVRPARAFIAGEVVTTTVTAGVRSSVGLTMPRPYTWSFTVATTSGTGVFAACQVLDMPTPGLATAADINGDGFLDLIVTSYTTKSAYLFLNNGAGGFIPAGSVVVGPGPLYVAAADLNGDSSIDLIVANYGSTTVSILLNDGHGGFGQTVIDLGPGHPHWLATGDFDGDGHLLTFR